MLPGKMACPKCQVTLKTDKPLFIGRQITCPNCGARFSIGTVMQGASWTAILVLLLGAVAFVASGVVLAIYCFTGEWPGFHQPQAREDHATEKEKAKKDDPHKNTDDQDHNKDQISKSKKQPGPLSHQQQLEVDKTIERGVAYLKSLQNKDGTWKATGDTLDSHPAGITALVGLTLLECDVKNTDPAVKKIAEHFRAVEASANKLNSTYDLALAMLFLDRLDDPRDAALIAKLGLRLVTGQTPSGGWSYDCLVLADDDSVALGKYLAETRSGVTADLTASRLNVETVDPAKLKIEGVGPLPGPLAELPVWRGQVVLDPKNVDADNSNTQFAVLALWIAKGRGVPVQRALARVVQRFHLSQNGDGSWGYEATGDRKATTGDGLPPGTMTCAGLVGLAVGQGLVNEARGNTVQGRKPAAQQDPAIQHGLDYLAKQVGDPHKPWQNITGAPLVNLYFLWSVERIGVIFNLDRIGGKDWYGWGAEILVANQTIKGDKGSWEAGDYYGQHPTVNSCFALLFLKRANLAKDLTRHLVLED